MSTFLGRWPLIPETYCDVGLPKDSLQAITTAPYLLTPYTDRLLHIQATRLMTIIMASPKWNTEKRDAEAVLRYSKHFQEELVDQLPPAYRLTDPDTSWDAALPSISRKREHLKANIYGIFAGLHRAFIDPYNNELSQTAAQLELAKSHHITLANACCETIYSIIRLHKLMDGSALQAFFIPMTLIEASAILGMSLLSARPQMVGLLQRMATGNVHWNPEMQQRLYDSFQDGLSLLAVLARSSKIARKGVKILKPLKFKVESHLNPASTSDFSHVTRSSTDSLTTSDVATGDDESRTAAIPISVADSTPSRFRDCEPTDITDEWAVSINSTEYAEPGWPAFAYSTDQSWFFNDDFFTLDTEQGLRFQ